MKSINEYVKQASNFHFPRVVNEYLSTKVKPSIIKATRFDLRLILKDEIKRLGDDADLNHIDVSQITDLSDMFFAKDYFCGDISKWKTGNCKKFDSMFYCCNKFNCDLSEWDVSNGETFVGMFEKCENFNSDLNDWKMDKAKDISGMLRLCINFNKPLYQWNTSNVKYMAQIFDGCEKFNQDISNWDVRKVYSHELAFRDCPMDEDFKPNFID